MPRKICSRWHSKIFIFIHFSAKTWLDISCELSAWQKIHMKCQDLFSLKNEKKKKKKKKKIILITKIVVCCSSDWHLRVNSYTAVLIKLHLLKCILRTFKKRRLIPLIPNSFVLDFLTRGREGGGWICFNNHSRPICEIIFKNHSYTPQPLYILFIATNQRVVAAKRQQRELVALW